MENQHQHLGVLVPQRKEKLNGWRDEGRDEFLEVHEKSIFFCNGLISTSQTNLYNYSVIGNMSPPKDAHFTLKFTVVLKMSVFSAEQA